MSATMASIERWLGNPFTRVILRWLSSDCARCGNRLELALDRFTGRKNSSPCASCLVASWIVGLTIKKSGDVFGVSDDSLKEGLLDPYLRRGLSTVIRGIARYGVTRPQRVDAPFLVVWDITHRCNLRCIHCYQDAHKAFPDEMSTEEAKKVLDDLSDAGVVAIAFSGGEPLMRPDMRELVSYAKDKGFFVSLASNGTLIDEHMANDLAARKLDYIEISVDGADAAHHDLFRGVPGAFDRAVAGIQACVGAGLDTGVATTVTRETVGQLPAIHQLAAGLGVSRMMCFNFVPTGRGTGMVDQDIPPDQREALHRWILGVDRRGNLPVLLSTAPQFARVAVEDEQGEGGIPVGHFYTGKGLEGKAAALAEFIGGCGAGRIYCSIEPEGTVQPCVFLPVPAGNLRQSSFAEIWHNSDVLSHLRSRENLKGNCGTCRYRLLCGGCRARAYAYFQDLDAPDPGCIRNRVLWDSLSSKAEAAHAS
ncbi:MAG: radical SAM protein [Methanolinea sp.]|nr:radical SAM protein [Methanolinea sp.]